MWSVWKESVFQLIELGDFWRRELSRIEFVWKSISLYHISNDIELKSVLHIDMLTASHQSHYVIVPKSSLCFAWFGTQIHKVILLTTFCFCEMHFVVYIKMHFYNEQIIQSLIEFHLR